MDTQNSSKQLRRTRDGKMIAGVCSGIARYLGVDANLVRLGLGVFTLFGGAGIGLYIVAWLVMPEDGAESSVAEDLFQKAKDNPSVQDATQKATQKAKDVFAAKPHSS
ncbi:PspC domain-containing protein [Actinomadura rupiterrae]|uniref:PspC domain-containing protein n=1 Tax=Actinomadura rupiterrae TaxID=559627 RepID=UPI0020A2AF0F|nr:PspC domain-containing protein [Actinomadura rupiterrae]MCP2337472.1 phage shock protein PspC (stress-responsive transcriptional regulator) [Actinomadura rupiterrae]